MHAERGRVSILVGRAAWNVLCELTSEGGAISSSPLGCGDIWDRRGRPEIDPRLRPPRIGPAPAGPIVFRPLGAKPSGIPGTHLQRRCRPFRRLSDPRVNRWSSTGFHPHRGVDLAPNCGLQTWWVDRVPFPLGKTVLIG